ncbi:peroxidase-related enzyme [Pusillimonas sp. ANT_WB101]|uniref:peroxidase-related enzyme n=1 Tax=Pusillimonas sp. ANT_WB101 TaxID=2597356 RepID=UPI0011EC7B63|nr:peroxidase-related enzyme [Pusillimonas sp. ANT_WB101]KAA0911215.1 peroxidase-related enzyme [Pusillimonas sp. ANT_WB101]
MPQPDYVSALGAPDPTSLDDDLQEVFQKCVDKLGLVPNVLQAYSARPNKLRNFMAMYNELMLGPSGLSKLDREMVAVVVSSANHCYYCLVAHGAAVRVLSGDPQLGEMMVMNYRVAPLDARQRAMLDFAWKLTKTPEIVVKADRDALRAVGLTTDDIFDLADTVGFFNMSNRMGIGIDMIPNPEYHGMARPEPFNPPAKKT